MKEFVPNTLGLKVQTLDGYKTFAGIAYMGDRPIIRIDFTNNRHLEVTPNHRLITPEGPVKISNLVVGNNVITKGGRKTKIKSIYDTGNTEPVYDLIEVEGNNTYYTNGILSHNCEFVTDDETLINPLTLSRMQGINPEFYTGTVRWFKEPEPNKTYIAALDPCVGTGYDYAAIQVYELPNMTQVAEWQHNQTAPRQQVAQLMKILFFIDQTLRDDPQQMGDPEIFWTVENNGLGEAILQIIEDTGEERFPGSFVSEKKRKGQSRRFRKGLNTDNRKKLSACARAKSLIESDRMTIKSNQLIKELKTFVSVDNSFRGKAGSHDDLVSAMLLCIRMLDVVLGWSTQVGDLREFIDEDELFGEEDMPMPVVI